LKLDQNHLQIYLQDLLIQQMSVEINHYIETTVLGDVQDIKYSVQIFGL